MRRHRLITKDDDIEIAAIECPPQAEIIVCANRCGAFSKTARNRALSTLWTQAGLTVERSDLVNGHSGALANDYGFADSPAGKFAAFQSIAIRIRERPLG